MSVMSGKEYITEMFTVQCIVYKYVHIHIHNEGRGDRTPRIVVFPSHICIGC